MFIFSSYFIISILLSSYLSSSFLLLIPHLSFVVLTVGFLLVLITIKAVISVSLIVGNLIDVYLFGIIAVLINWSLYAVAPGLVLGCLSIYLFSTNVSVYSVPSFTPELFSSIFQSITLANRLSINLIAGSLLIQLMIVAVVVTFSFSYYPSPLPFPFLFLLLLLLFIFTFEIVNCRIQLFTSSLLPLEYSVRSSIPSSSNEELYILLFKYTINDKI